MMMGVKVEGVSELINRLSKFDKDVYRILQREIKSGLEQVADDARSRTPDVRAIRGWGPWNETTGQSGRVGSVTLSTGSRDLGFRGSEVKRGIRPELVRRSSRGRVTKFSGRVTTKTPAGAIFALAGSRGGGSFEAALVRRHGNRWPRTLTAALYAKGPQAREQIRAAIDKAARSVTGRRV